MPNRENQQNLKAKWHQRWWGIIFLIIVAILLIYLAVFIYQVVFLIELQSQSRLQSQNFNFTQTLNPQVNIRDVVETKDDPAWGIDEAELVIVQFSDFQCSYSYQAYSVVKSLRQEYEDQIKFIYRDFPNLASHPDSLKAALAANCAFEQGQFWSYHDRLFENQNDLSLANLKFIASQLGLDLEQFNNCLDNEKYRTEIYNDMQDGARLGVTGTPTFFINGNKVPGVIPYETFKTIIERMK